MKDASNNLSLLGIRVTPEMKLKVITVMKRMNHSLAIAKQVCALTCHYIIYLLFLGQRCLYTAVIHAFFNSVYHYNTQHFD